MADVLNQLKQTIMNLKEQGVKKDTRIKELEEKVAAEAKHVDAIEGARAVLGEKFHKLEAELADTKQALTVAKGEEYKKEMDNAKKMVDVKSVKIAELEETIKRLTSDNAAQKELTKDSTYLLKKISSLSVEIEKLNAEKQALQERVKTLEETIKNTGLEKGVNTHEFLKLSTELANNAKVISDFVAEKKKLEGSITNMSAKVEVQDKQISALTGQIETMKTSNQDTLAQLTRETERSTKLDIQVTNLRKEKDTLGAEMMSKAPELAEMVNLKMKMQTTQDENAKLKDKVAELMGEIEKAKTEVAEKAKKIEELYVIHGGQKLEEGIIATLRSEVEQLKLKVQEVEGKYKSMSAINTSISSQLEITASDLKAQKEKPTGVKEKAEAIEKQAARILALEEELKSSKEQTKKLMDSMSLTDQSEQMKAVQLCNNQLSERVDKLQKHEQENKTMTAEIARMKESLRASENLFKLKTDEVAAMKKMTSDLEQKLAEQNQLFSDLSKLTSV